jgi:predicted nucleic acid-binding protein
VLFSRVLLPKRVRSELFSLPGREERLGKLSDSYGFIENCDDYDQTSVDILFSERKASGLRDRGEAEAVVQAAEIGAMVLIDDAWGRILAARFDRECHGTLWILRKFHELGLASAAETRARFVSVRERGIRLPWKVVNEFLAEIGESPIAAED